jgi:hypothetical protein
MAGKTRLVRKQFEQQLASNLENGILGFNLSSHYCSFEPADVARKTRRSGVGRRVPVTLSILGLLDITGFEDIAEPSRRTKRLISQIGRRSAVQQPYFTNTLSPIFRPMLRLPAG